MSPRFTKCELNSIKVNWNSRGVRRGSNQKKKKPSLEAIIINFIGCLYFYPKTSFYNLYTYDLCSLVNFLAQ